MKLLVAEDVVDKEDVGGEEGDDPGEVHGAGEERALL